MATTFAPSGPLPNLPKPQKRLFRSLSRFLSGKTSRPKLVPTIGRHVERTHEQHLSPNEAGVGVGQENGEFVPLKDVSSRSRRLTAGSNFSSIRTGDDGLRGDGASGISENSAGADTDASIRPISSESIAPSSLLSRTDSTSNISYAPTHATFKSYASTKPTTLFSIDSGGGANRIAVVPGTGGLPTNFPTSTSGHSLSPMSQSTSAGPGITFSAVPPSTPPSILNSLYQNSNTDSLAIQSAQVPRHTIAHPRNNPHPASPPPDNASMLTLASSTFAPSFSPSRYTSGGGGASLSGLRARRFEADEDASVRALAPSRRASDESLGSRSTWSAQAGIVRKEGAGSIKTVGTTGTGGELFGITGEHLENLEAQQEGKETEAQKVVRKIGGKGPSSQEVEPTISELQKTPTAESETILPHLKEPDLAESHDPLTAPVLKESTILSPSSLQSTSTVSVETHRALEDREDSSV